MTPVLATAISLPHLQPFSAFPTSLTPQGAVSSAHLALSSEACTEIVETVQQPLSIFIFLSPVKYQPFLY